jgi:Tfp pilus assembly protein PilF
MKEIIFLCVFLWAAEPVFAASEAGQAAFEAGMRFRQSGDLVEAEQQLRKAVTLDPSNPEYHFELANIYATRFDQFQDPSNPKVALVLDGAAYELQQVITLRPDYIAAHFNLGVILKRRGEYERARDQFRKVLALDSNTAAAWMQIGATYEDQGFFDEAKDAYEKAKEITVENPDIEEAMMNLDKHKYEREQEMGASDTFNRFKAFNQSSNYAEGTQAQRYDMEQRNQMGSSQGFQQAIPYVANYLIQEFMKRRQNKQSAEPE